MLLRTKAATVIALSSITSAATIVHPSAEVIQQDPREAARATTSVIPPGEVLLTALLLQIIGMVIKILLKWNSNPSEGEPQLFPRLLKLETIV